MLDTIWRRSGTPEQTQALAAAIAPVISPPCRIYLSGVLGAGKTLWVRALLCALGWRGRVLSPSYALVYSYPIGVFFLHHIDCFRLQGGSAGDDLLELLEDNAVCLVEWPEAATDLPPPDLSIRIEIQQDERRFYFSGDGVVAQRLLVALPPA